MPLLSEANKSTARSDEFNLKAQLGKFAVSNHSGGTCLSIPLSDESPWPTKALVSSI
jgi:hypothetical protein